MVGDSGCLSLTSWCHQYYVSPVPGLSPQLQLLIRQLSNCHYNTLKMALSGLISKVFSFSRGLVHFVDTLDYEIVCTERRSGT